MISIKPNGRVAVLSAPRSARIETRPVPAPGRTQVRVRLEGCGVCGSNLPVWEGRPWFTYPFPAGAPGHEGWGRVDAIGSDVEGIWPGSRVAILSYNAFADFDLAEADRVVRLPPKLGNKPFPGEALGCAFNVFRRSDIQPQHTVAIVGIGFMGALLTNLASAAGARVIAISRRRSALHAAKIMGARETIQFGDAAQVIGAVREVTGGVGCERVIEATGLQAPLDLASELTAERGRLMIAGYHQDGLRQINMQLWNWRGLDVINAHERDPRIYVQGMRAAAEAVASGQLDPWPLYTDQLKLEELPVAFDRMHERDGNFLKALLTYE
jgi:threonine dehydrogenase-like Zn-dependent dehydrogenase